MASRSQLPFYTALFVVPFALAAVGAFGVRTWQQSATTDTGATSEVVVVETTVPPTVPLVVETTTTVPSSTPPTEVVTTTTPPETQAPVKVPLPAAPKTADGALLTALSDADRRLYEDGNCDTLARPGTTARSCDITSSNGLDIAWVSMDEGLDVLVHVGSDGPDVWNVVLRSNKVVSRAPLFSDVSGDGEVELVAGWRPGDGTLNVDVVQFDGVTGSVTLHVAALDGRVSAGDGQLDVWSGLVASGADPGQLSSYVHWAYSNGPRWRVKASRDESPPSGQL